MRSTPSLTTFVIVAFRTVPVLVWFKMALSGKIVVRFLFPRPYPPGGRCFDALGFAAAGSASSSIVLGLHAWPASLSARSFPLTASCPGQRVHAEESSRVDIEL